MKIHLKQISAEGLHLEGEEDCPIPELAADGIRCVGPLRYDLDVGISAGALWAERGWECRIAHVFTASAASMMCVAIELKARAAGRVGRRHDYRAAAVAAFAHARLERNLAEQGTCSSSASARPPPLPNSGVGLPQCAHNR